MAKFFYFLRVLLFSPELLIILGAMLINDYFPNTVESVVSTITINENLVSYLMLAPLGLAVWILLEIRNLLQEDNATTNILTDWSDYWRLKTHTRVTIIYAVIFGLISLVPWCSEFVLKSRIGFLLFITSLLGQLCVALSLYNARIRVKEIIAKLI